MIKLPTGKRKATRINPSTVVFFANPKVGKTRSLSELEDCLILDLEEGSSFFDAMSIDIIGSAREEGVTPIAYLKKVIKEIEKANKEHEGFVYRRIALDTVTALETVVLPLANRLYQNTPMGKNWVPTAGSPDVTSLPNGAGYRYTRQALLMVIDELKPLCETLIIVGHVKDKLISVAGEEMNERMINLTGAMSAILASKVDVVGYLFRRGNKTIISFRSDEGTVAGGRCEHLTNKQFDLIVSDDDNNLTIDWTGIFKDE